MMLMLHIPRNGRLGDPVNIAQMLEIEERYPELRVVYAHIGRAYCPEDFGDAFEILKNTKHLMIDFSATTQEEAMYKALEAVGPKRILFGSDLPILRMRMKRICEGGRYINIVPQGLYGDISGDPNMREASDKEKGQLSFFMYEELRAFLRAATRIGLKKKQLDQVFYENAKEVINRTSKSLYGEVILK
jgi:predicted TIM-barrel fold metal-dependent hydrolase